MKGLHVKYLTLVKSAGSNSFFISGANLLAVRDNVKSIIEKVRPGKSRPGFGESMPSESGSGMSRPFRPGFGESMPSESGPGMSRPFNFGSGVTRSYPSGFGVSMPSETDSGKFHPFKFAPGKERPNHGKNCSKFLFSL